MSTTGWPPAVLSELRKTLQDVCISRQRGWAKSPLDLDRMKEDRRGENKKFGEELNPLRIETCGCFCDAQRILLQGGTG